MTTNPTPTDPAHEPAPASLVPELAVSHEAVAAIRRLTSLVQTCGLMDAAQAVYEVALPEYRRSVASLVDGALYSLAAERMGWSEMHDEVAELAAALMAAVEIHEVDHILPPWITQEDRDERDEEAARTLALLRPGLMAD